MSKSTIPKSQSNASADTRSVQPVGYISASESGFAINVEDPYCDGLRGLEDFSHLNVMWLAKRPSDEPPLTLERPYVNGPDEVGIFSTRSTERPNGIGISVCQILSIDASTGTIDLGWIDAHDGTPVVDIKPYFPSSDRVRESSIPDWCSDWPDCLEASASFDWESVFS